MTKLQKKQLVINESMRYINNAKDVLKEKARLSGDFYEDKKYVKAAGHYVYNGILHAINEAGIVKLKKGQRPDVKDYVGALAKENKKMLNYFNQCYQTFHLDWGYDGIANKRTLPVYMEYATELITWAANKAAA